jgi:GNAT superfamily N-acetyltransferase
MTLTPHLVEVLADAFQVRAIRNQCCQFMTRHRAVVSLWDQVKWFHGVYRPALLTGEYRIWLFHAPDRTPVGYASLRLEQARTADILSAYGPPSLWVTEAVAESWRGNRIGTQMLAEMIRIADAEKLPLRAEIWADNIPSMHLHQSANFATYGSEHRENRLLYYLQRQPA